jgi:hypothetical protein
VSFVLNLFRRIGTNRGQGTTQPRAGLLAWIRTGLALMGFGFVFARFGLFLRDLAAMRGGDLKRG